MTDKPKAVALAEEGMQLHHYSSPEFIVCAAVLQLYAENEALRKVLNSRPAINAGLPGTYIEWSSKVYAMDLAHAGEVMQ